MNNVTEQQRFFEISIPKHGVPGNDGHFQNQQFSNNSYHLQSQQHSQNLNDRPPLQYDDSYGGCHLDNNQYPGTYFDSRVSAGFSSQSQITSFQPQLQYQTSDLLDEELPLQHSSQMPELQHIEPPLNQSLNIQEMTQMEQLPAVAHIILPLQHHQRFLEPVDLFHPQPLRISVPFQFPIQQQIIVAAPPQTLDTLQEPFAKVRGAELRSSELAQNSFVTTQLSIHDQYAQNNQNWREQSDTSPVTTANGYTIAANQTDGVIYPPDNKKPVLYNAMNEQQESDDKYQQEIVYTVPNDQVTQVYTVSSIQQDQYSEFEDTQKEETPNSSNIQEMVVDEPPLMEPESTDKNSMSTFRCSTCASTFSRKCELQSHLVVHISVKPYKCFCGKLFKRKGDCMRHKKRHQGNSQLFMCQGATNGKRWGCNKRYCRKDVRSKHWKSKNGFKCVAEYLSAVLNKNINSKFLTESDLRNAAERVEKIMNCDVYSDMARCSGYANKE